MIFSPPLEITSAMPFVMIGWPELTLTVLVICLISSILNLSGNMCMARAYQTADSSWLAPLDFTYLLFAALWGRVLFDSWPSFYSSDWNAFDYNSWINNGVARGLSPVEKLNQPQELFNIKDVFSGLWTAVFLGEMITATKQKTGVFKVN